MSFLRRLTRRKIAGRPVLPDARCLFEKRFVRWRPTVLCVSPYAMYPPGHGGARRMYELYRRLGQKWNVIVLSDEGESYDNLAEIWTDERPSALFTVRGRTEKPEQRNCRQGRIISHSRSELSDCIDVIVAHYAVDIVLIEYIELAYLISRRSQPLPWVLDLHDVLIDGRDIAADEFERRLIGLYDAVATASPEDQSLLESSSILIENGVGMRSLRVAPSKSDGPILFAGPFRYPPNLAGSRAFAAEVFPKLRAENPGQTLRILAGPGGREAVKRYSELNQDGIEIVLDYRDMKKQLSESVLTINPVTGIRGSPLKVAESLAAGRVCVATHDGSRGFSRLGASSLLSVDKVSSMFDPIVGLLANHNERWRLEQSGRRSLAPLDWKCVSAKLDHVLRDLL